MKKKFLSAVKHTPIILASFISSFVIAPPPTEDTFTATPKERAAIMLYQSSLFARPGEQVTELSPEEIAIHLNELRKEHGNIETALWVFRARNPNAPLEIVETIANQMRAEELLKAERSRREAQVRIAERERRAQLAEQEKQRGEQESAQLAERLAQQAEMQKWIQSFDRRIAEREGLHEAQKIQDQEQAVAEQHRLAQEEANIREAQRLQAEQDALLAQQLQQRSQEEADRLTALQLQEAYMRKAQLAEQRERAQANRQEALMGNRQAELDMIIDAATAEAQRQLEQEDEGWMVVPSAAAQLPEPQWQEKRGALAWTREQFINRLQPAAGRAVREIKPEQVDAVRDQLLRLVQNSRKKQLFELAIKAVATGIKRALPAR